MNDAVVAVLTPAGRSALATLGLAGPHAWEIARRVFRTRSGQELPETPAEGRFWLGRLAGDDVVLAWLPGGRVEIHGHGGREMTHLLLDELVSQGACPCSAEQFLVHTEKDPLRVAALVALTHSRTVRTAAILLDQQAGALRSALETVEAHLLAGDHTAAADSVEALLRQAPVGIHLTEPWRVVVAGPPNVGKSSLVNALAGYQRSIVAPTPGTTRDVVSTTLAIDGWPVELIDTAGLRQAGEHLEEQGIRQARDTAATADLILWLLDASTEPVWPSPPLSNVRLIVNKIDLPSAWDLSRAEGAVRVSAASGEGVAELCSAISRWLVPVPPQPGTAVLITQEQVLALQHMQARFVEGNLDAAQTGLRSLLGH